jgi:hypothetical protein
MADSSALSDLADMGAKLASAANDAELFEVIVNTPFSDRLKATSIDLGIVVLLLVDKKQKKIDRVALSKTEPAAGTLKMTLKPFKSIKIPLTHYENIIAEAIRSQKPQMTSDWYYLFTPALSAQAARLNQSGGGIECSYVFPLTARDGGALIFSFFQPPVNIKKRHKNFMEGYSKLVDKSLKPK